jgi:hypothetical protein
MNSNTQADAASEIISVRQRPWGWKDAALLSMLVLSALLLGGMHVSSL